MTWPRVSIIDAPDGMCAAQVEMEAGRTTADRGRGGRARYHAIGRPANTEVQALRHLIEDLTIAITGEQPI